MKPSEAKPLDKLKQAKKDLFWFKVEENSTSSCKNVSEDSLGSLLIEGPPADTCTEDGLKFCLCGKKGKEVKKNWRYMCGKCKENKPFSFKIEKGKGGKGKGKGKGRPGKRPGRKEKKPV